MNKLMILLTAFLLVFALSTTVLAKEGGSGHGGGMSGGDDRVRVEVRASEDEPGENRFRFESRDDENRVRIELRAEDEAEEDELPNFEIEGNTFEITGMVTTFTGGTVTIDGRSITINPSLVEGFEQEGTIEVGEVIKVEGMVAADGSLLAREIKANGVDIEAGLSGTSLSALIAQIAAFLQSLV